MNEGDIAVGDVKVHMRDFVAKVEHSQKPTTKVSSTLERVPQGGLG